MEGLLTVSSVNELRKLVAYNWKDEQRHYEALEDGEGADKHIFLTLTRLDRLCKDAVKLIKQSTNAYPEALLLNQLISMNNNFGRGDVISVDFTNHTVVVRTQYTIQTVKFRTNGDTVYFRGHRRVFM